MSIPLTEPIDYSLHPAFYGNDSSQVLSQPEEINPIMDEAEVDEITNLVNHRSEAIKEIALFIFSSILFVAAIALLVTSGVALISASIPLLPFLIPGLVSATLSGLIFYNLFKGSD